MSGIALCCHKEAAHLQLTKEAIFEEVFMNLVNLRVVDSCIHRLTSWWIVNMYNLLCNTPYSPLWLNLFLRTVLPSLPASIYCPDRRQLS